MHEFKIFASSQNREYKKPLDIGSSIYKENRPIYETYILICGILRVNNGIITVSLDGSAFAFSLFKLFDHSAWTLFKAKHIEAILFTSDSLIFNNIFKLFCKLSIL